MWTYHPELLERTVPRYTSYPTAAEFIPDVGADRQAEALQAIEPGTEVSIYVHIPFCSEICWYCGCNTARANRSHRLTAYLDSLASEIETVARHLAGKGRVTRVALGGGSPNALSPIEFVRLLDLIFVTFSMHRPVLSVEIDPRGFTEEWALVLGRCGVSRVSLGVQTFDPDIQKNVGRVQSLDMIRRVVTRLREHDVSSINFDLMYGLPGQDLPRLTETLEQTIELAPERVALFGYAHVPHLLPRQRRIDVGTLPDQALRFAMASHGHQCLTEAGYRTIGFDHFAVPDDPVAETAAADRLHRNFQGFTDDGCKVLIGLGASAISQFPGLIVQNEKNSGRYRMMTSSRRLAATRGVQRTDEDRFRACMIERLLCGSAVMLPDPLGRMMANQLQPFIARGLARLNNLSLSITAEGLPYARTIASLFDQYRSEQKPLFSNAI